MKRRQIFALLAVSVFAFLQASCHKNTSVDMETKADEIDVTLNLEGDPTDVTFSPVKEPAFTIYVDLDSYEVSEENGVTHIRKIIILPTEESVRENNRKLLEGLTPEEEEEEVRRILSEHLSFYNNLPPCEMEIQHLEDILPEQAAEAVRKTVDSASEITQCQQPDGISFNRSEGQEWNSVQEAYFFVSDNAGGTFQISIRYYLEAIGVYINLRTMLQTFEVAVP